VIWGSARSTVLLVEFGQMLQVCHLETLVSDWFLMQPQALDLPFLNADQFNPAESRAMSAAKSASPQFLVFRLL